MRREAIPHNGQSAAAISERTVKIVESVVSLTLSNANPLSTSDEIRKSVRMAAHTVMSKQALESDKVREGLKDVLLGPGQLYEALREKAGGQGRDDGVHPG